MQEVPIVTTRLHSFKGKTRLELLNDTSDTRLPRDVINREYRITYRDTLSRNEKLGEGEIQQIRTDSIFITVHDLHAERMEAKIGDEIVFDVQGTLVKTYIGGIRKIEFNRVETSFTIVFPTGKLEDAPQFHVLITRMPDNRTSAEYQQAIVNQYPNVSMIDLDLILKTVDQVLGQISFVIQFIAMFSILTGLIVLFSSILLSKYQRIQESVLLRTLGASRKQILYINALEYFFLGSLASLTGILLALLSTYLLAVYIFEIPYEISLLPSLCIYFIITLICILIGLFNSREILNKSPLEILREEN
jgi:putative ABC transport system permease protein